MMPFESHLAQLKRSFIHSLAYRQQLTLFFPLLTFTLENLELSFSLALLNLRNYCKSNFDLAAKSPLVKLFYVTFLLSRKNAHLRKYSKSDYGLAAKSP